MKHVVLIPAYQPDQKLLELLTELSEYVSDIVIVDDGSGTGYGDIFGAAREKAKVISYEVNRGKGGALKEGLTFIRDNISAPYAVVTADADGQHTVRDILRLFEAAEEIENSFGDDMLRDASVYFKELTHGAYDEIIIGSDHKPMLRSGDRIVDITSVSRGTIEQAYLCIRLAASECIAKVSMPLLLDDTFAFFDDERTKSALKLLKNSNHQVIIMTCQKREKQLIQA